MTRVLSRICRRFRLLVAAFLVAVTGWAYAEAPPVAEFDGEGVRIRVWLAPVAARTSAEPLTTQTTTDREPALRRGDRARLRVHVDAEGPDGEALGGIRPVAWLDWLDGDAPDDKACARRIGGYVARRFGERAWRAIDGYQVLLLNSDAGISILDPQTSFAGKTSLRGSVPLPAAGLDWDLSPGHDRLYVGVPETRQLAIVDLVSLGEPVLVKLAGSPGRVRIHPDGRHLWVGIPRADSRRTNTGVQPAQGGVAVVPVDAPERGRWITTGDGHHEIAFDPAGLVAVTNRDSGTVTFVDPASTTVRHNVSTAGGLPLGVVFAPRQRRFIVADARHGRLLPYDRHGTADEAGALPVGEGIGALALTPDGRWLFALNAAAGEVVIVDLARWQTAHRIAVPGRPFQLEFAGDYAYVRALDSEEIRLIHWPSLDAGAARVQRFVAGEKRPGETPDLPLASQMSALPDGMGIFALSPGDGTVYTYMQGMNAPTAGISPRGHGLRAVRVARQGLIETGKGRYQAVTMLPPGERLLLALATDQPRLRHCLAIALEPQAPLASAAVPTRLHWEVGTFSPGPGPGMGPLPVAVVIDGDARRAWPESLTLLAFRPGGSRQALPALLRRRDPLGSERVRITYRAETGSLAPGVYYVHVQSSADGPVTPSLARRYASFEIAESRP